MSGDDYDDIDGWADPDGEPEIPRDGLDDFRVMRMLAAMRRLSDEIQHYEAMHAVEQARLDAAHEANVGPMMRRFRQLEQAVIGYGVARYETDGTTRIATPNGTIRAGRPLVEGFTIDDESLARWVGEHTGADDIVSLKPKVGVTRLREVLAEMETLGHVQRCITRVYGNAERPVALIDVGARYTLALMDGERGRWLHHPGDAEREALVPGIEWVPAGERGLGRKWNVELS